MPLTKEFAWISILDALLDGVDTLGKRYLGGRVKSDPKCPHLSTKSSHYLWLVCSKMFILNLPCWEKLDFFLRNLIQFTVLRFVLRIIWFSNRKPYITLKHYCANQLKIIAQWLSAFTRALLRFHARQLDAAVLFICMMKTIFHGVKQKEVP